MDDMGDGMSGEVSLSDLTQITNGLGPVEICDAAADAEFMRKGRDEVQ